MSSKQTYYREDLLALTPHQYLGLGFLNADGELRPEFYGLYATATATQFEDATVDPKELEIVYEGLLQILPLHQGSPSERYRAAINETVETVVMMMGGGEVHPTIVNWLDDFSDTIKTDQDLDAFTTFFQAVVRQYTLIIAIKQTGG